MKLTSSKDAVASVRAGVLIFPVFEGDLVSRSPLKEIEKALPGTAAALESGRIASLPNETTFWPGGDLNCDGVLFVGAGKRAEANTDVMRRVYGTAARSLRKKASSAAAVLRSDSHAQVCVEGILVALLQPDLYRSSRSETILSELLVLGSGDVSKAIESGLAIGEATNFCRTLVTMTPNDLTPTTLAAQASDELTPLGVTVKTLKGKELAQFGGLNGVSKGSSEPCVLITMDWAPAKARKSPVLGLVGKGVTFDSGGLSLKPSEGMTWMKGDMAGAAAVIAAMKAIATLKLPIRVKAACPATENMPSGTAIRVGDVLNMYSGKTVEVLNTDAEGRLILADALAWMGEQGVTHMANAATLTGSVSVALGPVCMGVMGRPDSWVDKVLRACRKAGEPAWPLPVYAEYGEALKSEVADIKNIGGRAGGTITAAKFLEAFVPDEIPWAHLDIAGVAWDDGKAFRAKGASGVAVRSFVQLAQDLSKA